MSNENLKIWYVKCLDEGWDTYNGFVVIGKDEKDVNKFIKKEYSVGKLATPKQIGIADSVYKKTQLVMYAYIAG